jgi:hypothetical protein
MIERQLRPSRMLSAQSSFGSIVFVYDPTLLRESGSYLHDRSSLPLQPTCLSGFRTSFSPNCTLSHNFKPNVSALFQAPSAVSLPPSGSWRS